MKTRAETLADRVRQRLAMTGLEAKAVSIRAGHKAGYLSDLFAGRKSSVKDLLGIARVLRTNVLWLQTGTGDPDRIEGEEHGDPPPPPDAPRERLIPVLGRAAGSVIGRFAIGDVIDSVPCPPGLMHIAGVYALWVTGSSMSPRFESGDLILCVPGRDPRPGEAVVIQSRLHDNDLIEAHVKVFARVDGDDIVTRQINPPAEIRFRRAQVLRVDRVATTAEMIGRPA